MRFNVKKYLTVLAIFLFAAVAWASTRKDSAPYDVNQSIEIGQTQLKPGHYTLKANEAKDQLRVVHDGKVVATVPCHWVKLTQKANNSEVLSQSDHVTRVEFQGRSEAASIG